MTPIPTNQRKITRTTAAYADVDVDLITNVLHAENLPARRDADRHPINHPQPHPEPRTIPAFGHGATDGPGTIAGAGDATSSTKLPIKLPGTKRIRRNPFPDML